MRILLVAPMLPQREGGAIAMLLRSELAGLAQRHEVTFVSAVGDEPGEADAARELASTGLDVHVADRRRPAGSVERWRRRTRLARAWAREGWPWRTVWFAEPGVQAILDRLAATRAFDVVAVEDSSMSVFRFPAGIPAVLTEHEVRRPRPLNAHAGVRPMLAELDWQRWHGFQRSTWPRFERIQCFTERDAKLAAEIAPEVEPRLCVNPFGVILPEPVDPALEQPGTVLFVGNFTHPPNRDAARWLALEILPRLRALHPPARLQLVGSSAPPDIVALGGPGVEVVTDAPEIRPHLEQAAIVAAPVRTGNGMRMKVLHALGSQKAVVTTSRGAEGYLEAGEDPPFALADDADGLAKVMAELLADDRARHELARRGRAFAYTRHSHLAWASRLEAVYEEARAEAAHG
jgi:glycosyltransferase involved in cell wall biosynthesis